MRKTIIFAIIIAAIAGIFFAAFRYSKKAPAPIETKQSGPISVTTQTPIESMSLTQSIQYPAVTAGDQEITLTAQTSGTITRLNFDLGSKVGQNSQIVKIDSIGNFSSVGDEGLQSSNEKTLGWAVDSAEARYKAAHDAYLHDKTYANKQALKEAAINLSIAKTNLKGALDAHYIVAPISGTITEKFVSQGDSVSAGQTLATISKTGLTKVQFYINKEDLPAFKKDLSIVINEDGNQIPGTITNVAPEADSTTRRFLVEAKPSDKTKLIIGSIIYVTYQVVKTPSNPGGLILPLSVITVGQNENYIFITENGKARKVNVEIVDVVGEAAEIKADIPQDAQIIIGGSKLVKDGDNVVIGS